jgi:uncharacterized cupin superfamily protein
VASDTWFVLNARDAPWFERPGRGFYCEIEEGRDFPQLGINVQVLGPGEPMAMYHYENDQEDFLVLSGEAVAIVEGEERPLRVWDFLHCPPGAGHVIVGAGEGPCVVLAVGARVRSTGPDWGAYTVDENAIARGAGVDVETSSPDEAYAPFRRGGRAPRRVGYPEGLLPRRAARRR